MGEKGSIWEISTFYQLCYKPKTALKKKKNPLKRIALDIVLSSYDNHREEFLWATKRSLQTDVRALKRVMTEESSKS